MENFLGTHIKTFFAFEGGQINPQWKKSRILDQKFDFELSFLQIGDFSDFMEYGKITPDACRNSPHRSRLWSNFLLLLMLKDSVI